VRIRLRGLAARVALDADRQRRLTTGGTAPLWRAVDVGRVVDDQEDEAFAAAVGDAVPLVCRDLDGGAWRVVVGKTCSAICTLPLPLRK
jgi:hypothetical protein